MGMFDMQKKNYDVIHSGGFIIFHKYVGNTGFLENVESHHVQNSCQPKKWLITILGMKIFFCLGRKDFCPYNSHQN